MAMRTKPLQNKKQNKKHCIDTLPNETLVSVSLAVARERFHASPDRFSGDFL
jgi:hypothetical protein